MQGLVLKKTYHGLDGKMASFVQGPCKDFYHGWLALCKDSAKDLYNGFALCKDSGKKKKNSTMDGMVRWQALCKDHVKISTMDGKLYTRTMQKISTI